MGKGKCNNLVGKNFGYLEVINKTPIRKHNHVVWECKCTCGELVYKRSNELNSSNKILSCGCKDNRYINSISINKVFGDLKVIEILNKKQIKCECKCGKICIKRINHVVSGNTKSCGCLAYENYLKMIPKALEKNIFLNTNIGRIQSKNISKRNTTGVTGVYYNKKNNNWFAKITFQKTIYNLGFFDKKEKAINARKFAEERLFGNFIEWYYETYPEKKKKESN